MLKGTQSQTTIRLYNGVQRVDIGKDGSVDGPGLTGISPRELMRLRHNAPNAAETEEADRRRARPVCELV